MSKIRRNSFESSELARHLDDHDKLLEIVTDSKARLEEHAKDVDILRQEIAKVKPSALTLAKVVVPILIAIVTGAWTINSALSDRPTSSQVESKITDKLKDLPGIMKEQLEQGRKLDRVEILLQNLVEDLKELKGK